MASGAGKGATEANINIGKTFAHITKFKEGGFTVWLTSITVTLMSVTGVSSTMANVHVLLQYFEKYQGLTLEELHQKIEDQTGSSWSEANEIKEGHEYQVTNCALYQIIYILLDESIVNLQRSAATKFRFNGIDLLKHMYDKHGARRKNEAVEQSAQYYGREAIA